MSTTTKSFVLTDPRTFDGDPFEIAERSVRQAAAMAGLLSEAVAGARLMARNAEMERDLLLTGSCNAAEFDESAQGRRYDSVEGSVDEAQRNLKVLATVAAFDPRKR